MSETASPLARTNTTSSIASSVTSSHRGGILLNPSDRASSSLGFAARSSSPAFSESPSHRHHINFAPLPKAEFDDGRPRRSSISIGVLSRSQMIKSQGGRKPKQGEVRYVPMSDEDWEAYKKQYSSSSSSSTTEELPDLGTLALRGGKKLFTKLASRSSRSRSGSNASSTSTSTSQIDAGSTLLPKPQPNIIPPANPNERPLIARFDSTGSSASASSYASSSLNDPRPSIPSPPQQEDVREEDEDSVDLGPLPLSASTPLPQTASSVPHRPSAHQPRASSYINRPHSPPPSAFNYSSDVEEETSSSAYDSSDELDLDLSPDLPTAAERSKSSSEEDRAEVWTGSGKGWKARMVAEGMGGGGGKEGNGGGLLGEGEATPRRRSPTPQAHSQLPSIS